MAKGQSSLILRHIRDIVAADRDGEPSDRVLLERFLRDKEEADFAALVGRHGPLVLGVCRRVLDHEQDAEDVFQATFLVFARKAGSIRKFDSVGSWLYGVAYRLALKVQTSAARRRKRERQAVTMKPTDTEAAAQWQDLLPIVDEELNRLPEKYRAPLVLCYLEGKSNAEAARVLGCPPGSMSKRLSRARELLRRQLVRRGAALSSATLAALAAENAGAAVPAGLLRASVRAGLLAATGQTVTGAVSTHVARLAEGMVKAMFITKLKIGAGLLLGMVVLIASAGWLTRQTVAAPRGDGSADESTLTIAREIPADLAVVPPDAMGFARIALSDLWEVESAKGLRGRVFEALGYSSDELERKLGVAPDNVQTITFIVLPPADMNVRPPIIAAITTARPYARQKLLDALVPGGKPRETRGKSQVASGANQTLALHFVNEHTFLIGEPGVLGRRLDRPAPQGGGAVNSALDLALRSHHVIAGFQIPQIVTELLKKEPLPPVAQFMAPALDVQSGALVMDVGSKAEMQVNLRFADEAKAGEAAVAIQAGINMLKQQLPKFAVKDLKNPQIAPLVKELESALKSARAEQRADVVQITAHSAALSLVDVILPSVRAIRVQASRLKSQNNLKQFGLAMHTFHDANGYFPPAALRDEDGKPLLSWRVAILPYIEQNELYKEFKLDQPWDSPHNKRLLARMPPMYKPVNVETTEPSLTYYQVFTGKETVFESRKGARIQDITDGASNTIMLVEAGEPVPWTKPEDLPYDPEKPLPKLGGLFAEGFNATFCDGSVHFLPKNIDERTLRALITRNGGELIERLP